MCVPRTDSFHDFSRIQDVALPSTATWGVQLPLQYALDLYGVQQMRKYSRRYKFERAVHPPYVVLHRVVVVVGGTEEVTRPFETIVAVGAG